MSRKLAILLFILVIISICSISAGIARPIKNWVYENHINDKITHFFFASLLTFLAYFIFYPRALRLWFVTIPLGTLLLLIIFAVEETSQVFVPGRDADPLDLLASWSGLLLGNYLGVWWKNRELKKAGGQTS